MSGPRVQGLAIAQQVALWLKGTLAPVEITVRTGVGSVHVVAAALDGTTVEPNRPFIGHVIAVGIAKFPNMRRGAHINGSFVHEDAFRERQSFGEDG